MSLFYLGRNYQGAEIGKLAWRAPPNFQSKIIVRVKTVSL